MKALYDLRDKLCEELEEVAQKQELSMGDLDTVHKLTDTIKNIDKICMMDEGGGYSQAGDWEARGRFGRNSYDDGDAYAMDGMRGGYSREGGYRQSGRRGRSRTTGRYVSRAEGKDKMRETIEDMLQESELSPEEARSLKRALDSLKE